MPYKSEKQRRFIHAKADEGEGWAKKFAAHSDGKKKAVKKAKRKRVK